MNFDYEQIEQYIKGELKGEALANFEAKLLIDKALSEEVALYKDVEMTLTSAYAHKAEDAQLEQTFSQLGKKYFNKSTETIQETDSTKIKQDKTKTVTLQAIPKEKTINRRANFRWLRPAIGLAVAASIFLLVWKPWQGSSIGDYYEPYVLNTTERSGDEEALAQAQKAYQSGNYAAVLPIFERYPQNIEIQLAKGNAEYNLGKLREAAATFKGIASRNSVYTPTANWYLALTYIQQDQAEKAKVALTEIKSGEYYDRAQKLLKKIPNSK